MGFCTEAHSGSTYAQLLLNKTVVVQQCDRLRWLGNVFRMSDDRLPKKPLFGQVKGWCMQGHPISGCSAAWVVKHATAIHPYGGAPEQTTLERQELPCACLAGKRLLIVITGHTYNSHTSMTDKAAM